MPRRNLDRHFADERPEWTQRKHQLLGRYVVPAATKISRADQFGRVHLVDGFAGPNEYGGQVLGSTTILIGAAAKLISQGRQVCVHACEVDSKRFAALTANLSQHIDSGLVRVYNKSHAAAVPEIKESVGGAPAIIFLDPQTVVQMTLADDLRPWAIRKRTDILGVFMASQACRICTSALSSGAESAKAELALGPSWREARTEATAVRVYLEQLQQLKKFAGLYMLRKVEPEQYAYGIFGLSDSAHGYWLLSDAVAKDAANLQVADKAKRGEHLFSEVDQEVSQETLLERLVDLVRPFLLKDPTLSGENLAIKVLESLEGVQEMFGKYQGRDFTAAANRLLGKPARRTRSAEAK